MKHEITLTMLSPESFDGVCSCSERTHETSRNNAFYWSAFHLAMVGEIKMVDKSE